MNATSPQIPRTRFLSQDALVLWGIMRLWIYASVVINILLIIGRDQYWYNAESFVDTTTVIISVIALVIAIASIQKRFSNTHAIDLVYTGVIGGFIIGGIESLFLFFWTIKIWSFINIIRAPIHWAVIGALCGYIYYVITHNEKIKNKFFTFISYIKSYMSSRPRPRTSSQAKPEQERQIVRITVKDQ